MSKVKNILFDLGGVILNLDRDAALNAFKDLGFDDIELVLKDFKQAGTFLKFEDGTINAPTFRDEIRSHIGKDVSDADIDSAWGKMTSHIEPGMLELLVELRTKYRVFLLSNTNPIHIDICNPMFEMDGKLGFSSFFEQCFYSFELRCCKPEPKIFLDVLQLADIEASETLFVDDSEANLLSASSLGFLTQFVSSPKDVKQCLKGLSIC